MLVAVAVAGSARGARCPNVMLVLDRSGSMSQDPAGISMPWDASKWEILQDAVRMILGSYGDQVPFGLQMFTSDGPGDATCYAETKIDVEPAHGTKALIEAEVLGASPKPGGGTNTGEAITRAMADPVMQNPARREFVILITDGDPTCHSGDFPHADFTLKQIRAATAMGLHTFVIGFDAGPGVSAANLNLMAKAGSEPQPGCDATAKAPCYYSASNAAAVNEALASILGRVTGGEFGVGTCTDACELSGCDPGLYCGIDGKDAAPHCIPDPCKGAKCPPGSFCREGACIEACLRPCGAETRCEDGHCVPDPCAGQRCGAGRACDPSSGACVANQCGGHTCLPAMMCDPVSGNCVMDECKMVSCPSYTRCRAGGNCEVFDEDGGTGGGMRSKGCQIGRTGHVQGSSPGGPGSASLSIFLIAAAFVVRARRRTSRQPTSINGVPRE